ncbi:unnamed protein product [Ascophyllum nodosum]
MSDSISRRRPCWLTDYADIPIPPTEEDFVMVGNLLKRRGGFGKMAHQRWKNRCFVLLDTGTLCYFQASSFADVDFCEPPRGILALDGDVVIDRSTKPDGDFPGVMAMIIQAGAQRWKLSSETAGEVQRWEEALKTMIKRSIPFSRVASNSTRSLNFDSAIKNEAIVAGTGPAQPRTPRLRSSNGPVPPEVVVKVANAMESVVSADNSDDLDVWDFVYALAAVDIACYFLYKYEVSVALFYATVLLVNLVIGLCILRRSRSSRRRKSRPGVPLIHAEGVGTLRVALKRRFPSKKVLQPVHLSEVGAVSDGIPSASSTMIQFEGTPGDLNAPAHAWGEGDHTIFRLRGKRYIQDKVKAEPADSLYYMVGMDTFATEARVGNLASEVDLGPISQNLPKISVPGVRPLLILNVQLPSASPALMSSAEDGPGYQCVFYFRMKESTVRALENLETASEAVKLWVAYCQHMGVDDEYHGRFKCVAVIANYERLGLPGFVTKYNGRPVLINKSGKWVRGESYIENTINVHRFSFIAKKSLHSLKSIFKDMVLHLGFTIEGRSTDELPESILACATLYYPRMESAVEFDI